MTGTKRGNKRGRKSRSQTKDSQPKEGNTSQQGDDKPQPQQRGINKMSEDALDTIVEFSEDINDAEPPIPLPIGEYQASIVSAETAVGQSSGKKYANVGFHVPVDQYPADFAAEQEPDGVTIQYRRVSLEDNQRGRFSVKRFCEAIGAPMSKRIDVTEWIGLEAVIHVGNTEYEGMPRAEILKVTSIN